MGEIMIQLERLELRGLVLFTDLREFQKIIMSIYRIIKNYECSVIIYTSEALETEEGDFYLILCDFMLSYYNIYD